MKELVNAAIIRAAEEGNKEKIKVLLQKGATINLQDNIGKTALMRAAARGHKEVVEFLFKHGTINNLQNKILKKL